MAWRLFGAKPLSEPMLPYCQLDPKEHILEKFYSKFFIQGNALENAICEMAAMLSQPQFVNVKCAKGPQIRYQHPLQFDAMHETHWLVHLYEKNNFIGPLKSGQGLKIQGIGWFEV